MIWRSGLVAIILGSLCFAFSIAPAQTAVPTTASATKPIRVATELWPGYTSATGTGAYFELLQIVLKPDPAPKIQLMSFGRAIAATERQQADIVFAVSSRDSRMLLRSNQPMDWDRIVAVYRDNPNITQALNDNQLHTLRLSWRVGYNYGIVLGLANHGYEAMSAEQGVQLALNERVDVFLSEEDELMSPQIQQWLSKNGKVQPVAVIPIYVGFSPSERGRQLKQQWDHGFTQVQQSADMQDFYRRHPSMRVPATP